MAIEKVGVYRKYRGPIPTDNTGKLLPKSEWKDKRPFSWAARWFSSGGQRYSRSFKTRKEAERFAETKQAEVRNGRGDPPKNCTLKEFFREHREISKGAMAHRTLVMQLSTLKLLAERVGWDRPLRKISSKDIEAYRAWRSEADLSTYTVNKEVKQLKRVFNLAIGRKYLPKDGNPCDGVALAKPGEKRPTYVPKEHFEMICAQARSSLARALVVVIYTTGLRYREAMNLTWDDVDFDNGVLHVAAKDRGGFVQKFVPKDHERREIPVPADGIGLLRELKEQAALDCPYVFMDGGRWEFYRQQVDQGHWRERRDVINNLLRKFQALCKRAKLAEKRYTLHDLRRSCITNWARMPKVSIQTVQTLAGHADIETTRKFYLSVQDEDLQAVRRGQQEVISGLRAIERTDPKLTHKPKRPVSLKRKVFASSLQLPEEKGVA